MAEPEPIRRRVLIAFDSATRCEAALDAAARLAAHMRAELDAMFVEDTDLLRLAGLPFVREVGRHAAPRGLDPQRMQRALEDYANEVQRALQASAQRARLEWRFQVARGRPLQQLLAAGVEGDLLVLARLGAQPVEAMRRVAAAVSAPVLVTWRNDGPGHRALEVAAEIATLDTRPLLVLIAADTPLAVAHGWHQVQTLLGGSRILAGYRQLPDLRPATLAAAARAEDADRLVQPLDLAPEDLESLSARLSCPLVLVR